MSHVVRHCQGSAVHVVGWAPIGLVRARQGPGGFRTGPYVSRTPIRDSSHPSGLDGVCRTMLGFRQVSVRTPIWHDGTRRVSTGRSTVPYRCTIDVRTPWARLGVPTGRLGPLRAPTDTRRPAAGTVRMIFIGGSRFGRPAAPIGAARATCHCQATMSKISD